MAILMACHGIPMRNKNPQEKIMLRKALTMPKQVTNGFEKIHEFNLKPLTKAKTVTKATEKGRYSKALPIFWANSFSRLFELTAKTSKSESCQFYKEQVGSGGSVIQVTSKNKIRGIVLNGQL